MWIDGMYEEFPPVYLFIVDVSPNHQTNQRIIVSSSERIGPYVPWSQWMERMKDAPIVSAPIDKKRNEINGNYVYEAADTASGEVR